MAKLVEEDHASKAVDVVCLTPTKVQGDKGLFKWSTQAKVQAKV